jgi:hypothetical protein
MAISRSPRRERWPSAAQHELSVISPRSGTSRAILFVERE